MSKGYGPGLGGGAYAQKRANKELVVLIQSLENRIKSLEEQVKTILADKGSIEAEVAKTKSLEDLKIAELKALCEEQGIDYTDFKVKKDYYPALKEKGL